MFDNLAGAQSMEDGLGRLASMTQDPNIVNGATSRLADAFASATAEPSAVHADALKQQGDDVAMM